jgi:hypothetical protein
VNPESLVGGDQFKGPRISLALQDTLHRAEISTAAIFSKVKIGGICKEFTTERSLLLKLINLTKDSFEEIKLTLQKQ